MFRLQISLFKVGFLIGHPDLTLIYAVGQRIIHQAGKFFINILPEQKFSRIRKIDHIIIPYIHIRARYIRGFRFSNTTCTGYDNSVLRLSVFVDPYGLSVLIHIFERRYHSLFAVFIRQPEAMIFRLINQLFFDIRIIRLCPFLQICQIMPVPCGILIACIHIHIRLQIRSRKLFRNLIDLIRIFLKHQGTFRAVTRKDITPRIICIPGCIHFALQRL